MKTVLRWTGVVVAAGTSVYGLSIKDYNSTVHDRFAGGFPLAPVPNAAPGFIGAGYDWSGVGWDAALTTRNIALISDRYFVYSSHWAPGTTLNFFSPTRYAANPLNPSAAVVSYTWTYANHVTFNNPYTLVPSDFSVGRLDAPINPADGLATYPILKFPTFGDYYDLTLLVYGWGTSPRIGVNHVDGFDNIDLDKNGTADTVAVLHFYDNLPNNASLQGGDSSGPLFTSFRGSLALLGTHSAVSNPPGVNYDNFIPVYLRAMETAGIDFQTVPEVPGLASATLLMLAALGYRWRQAQS